MIKVYGVPGWGSAISEVMLTLAEIPYHFINVDGFDSDGPQRELLKTMNPLCQVPTLVLENGSVMTETAAIALMILDRRPELSPPVGYRKSLYMWLNDQLNAEPYAFGDQLTLLDVYIAVMRTWGPGHDWFQDNTPNISAIADAVCQHPRLRTVLKNNKII